MLTSHDSVHYFFWILAAFTLWQKPTQSFLVSKAMSFRKRLGPGQPHLPTKAITCYAGLSIVGGLQKNTNYPSVSVHFMLDNNHIGSVSHHTLMKGFRAISMSYISQGRYI